MPSPTFIRTLLLALTLTAVGTAAVAHPPQRGRGQRGPKRPGGMLLNGPMARLENRLALNADQKKEIAEIRESYRKKTEEDWKAALEVRKKMRALWFSGEVPKKSEVTALQAEMRAHRVAMADAAIDARIAILKALEPTQRKRLGRRGPGRRGRGRAPR